jgi:hypothetical protein
VFHFRLLSTRDYDYWATALSLFLSPMDNTEKISQSLASLRLSLNRMKELLRPDTAVQRDWEQVLSGVFKLSNVMEEQMNGLESYLLDQPVSNVALTSERIESPVDSSDDENVTAITANDHSTDEAKESLIESEKSLPIERPESTIKSLPFQRRRQLPCPAPSTETVSLLSILKKNIGKDLSTVSMPIVLNEPLNVLQRICEDMEYCQLLENAAASEDPVSRMALVAGNLDHEFMSSLCHFWICSHAVSCH